MRVNSEGTALQAAVVASSVKRSASPFVKQGVVSSGGVEALRNINKMVNRSAAQSRAKQRSASRGNGSRSATPTPCSGLSTSSTTPGLGPDSGAADGALVSFTVAPEGGHCASETRPKPQRFRQFGALGGGGTLVPCASPAAKPAEPAEPTEQQRSTTCFFAPAGRASPSPSPSLGACGSFGGTFGGSFGGSGSGGDAAAAAEAGSCGGGLAGGGSLSNSMGGRINFKLSTGALLHPAPLAPHGGTMTVKPTPLPLGASLSGRGFLSSLPPTGLPPTGLLPRSGGLSIKTVASGTIKNTARGKSVLPL